MRTEEMIKRLESISYIQKHLQSAIDLFNEECGVIRIASRPLDGLQLSDGIGISRMRLSKVLGIPTEFAHRMCKDYPHTEIGTLANGDTVFQILTDPEYTHLMEVK